QRVVTQVADDVGAEVVADQDVGLGRTADGLDQVAAARIGDHAHVLVAAQGAGAVGQVDAGAAAGRGQAGEVQAERDDRAGGEAEAGRAGPCGGAGRVEEADQVDAGGSQFELVVGAALADEVVIDVRVVARGQVDHSGRLRSGSRCGRAGG